MWRRRHRRRSLLVFVRASSTPERGRYWCVAARSRTKKARCFRHFAISWPIIKAVMILAPRHPERFAEVAALVEKLGFRMWRRSLWGGELGSGEPLAGSVL